LTLIPSVGVKKKRLGKIPQTGDNYGNVVTEDYYALYNLQTSYTV
jgi:hypothetical protein